MRITRKESPYKNMGMILEVAGKWDEILEYRGEEGVRKYHLRIPLNSEGKLLTEQEGERLVGLARKILNSFKEEPPEMIEIGMGVKVCRRLGSAYDPKKARSIREEKGISLNYLSNFLAKRLEERTGVPVSYHTLRSAIGLYENPRRLHRAPLLTGRAGKTSSGTLEYLYWIKEVGGYDPFNLPLREENKSETETSS